MIRLTVLLTFRNRAKMHKCIRKCCKNSTKITENRNHSLVLWNNWLKTWCFSKLKTNIVLRRLEIWLLRLSLQITARSPLYRFPQQITAHSLLYRVPRGDTHVTPLVGPMEKLVSIRALGGRKRTCNVTGPLDRSSSRWFLTSMTCSKTCGA